MREDEIQKILEHQFLSNPMYALDNLYVFGWESDFLAKTRSGYWYEVEIKRTVSDFKNDAKHKGKKFKTLETGMEEGWDGKSVKAYRPNYFSYCVTENIVEKVKPLLPEYAGLWYVDEGHHRLVNVCCPRKLHSEKISDDELCLCEKFYYNMKNWKGKCMGWYKERMELKGKIQWLEAEYKAVSGESIWEQL